MHVCKHKLDLCNKRILPIINFGSQVCYHKC